MVNVGFGPEVAIEPHRSNGGFVRIAGIGGNGGEWPFLPKLLSVNTYGEL